MLAFSLWAVHISDGILDGTWLAGGFAVAAVLALFGAWHIKEEEIPQVAVLTAAFFVASLVHVRVPPTSVHLLLNGLLGVILGRRAALAIPVGLFLQAALIGHGGFSTLGVNSCVMVLPALFAWQLSASLRRVPWLRQRWFRAALVSGSTLLWILSLVYGLALVWADSRFDTIKGLLGNYAPDLPGTDTERAWSLALHPVTWTIAVILAMLAAWLEHRLENAPEFPLGLLIGETAVLATTFLNCLVLTLGTQEQESQPWQTLARLVFLAHLPIAAVEGIVLGFTIGFLSRVKPEMLGWVPPEKEECPLESIP
jgi:cobalt/nickel transport system permease protein